MCWLGLKAAVSGVMATVTALWVNLSLNPLSPSRQASVLWFRFGDLRVSDNAALWAAAGITSTGADGAVPAGSIPGGWVAGGR